MIHATSASERRNRFLDEDQRQSLFGGCGPGDPGLITVRGVECIQAADVILYDNLVNASLLRHARADAELIFVGKTPKSTHSRKMRSMRCLSRRPARAKIVTRLKGGDPFVFGRGGEEAEELQKAGLEFEIVPGISSSIAAPAYAGIPVTHRGVATAFMVITGTRGPDQGRLAGGLGRAWQSFLERA